MQKKHTKKIIIALIAIAAVIAVCLFSLSASNVLTASVSRTANWQDNNGINYSNIELKIKNNSSNPVSNWTATLSMPDNSEILNYWNGNYNLSGNTLTITPADYNTKINGSSEISLGFIFKSPSDELPKNVDATPDKVLPQNENISDSSGNITAEVKKDTSWRGNNKEFTQITVKLTNNSSDYATDWNFTIGIPDNAEVNQCWGCNAKANGSVISAAPVDYTNNIAPDSSVSFGIIIQTDYTYIPSEYSININSGYSNTKPEYSSGTPNYSENSQTDASTQTSSENTTEQTTEASQQTASPAAAASNGVSAHGQLKLKGTQLVGKNDETVVLHGMSSHGIAWFPEFTSEHSIKNTKEYGANLFRVSMYTDEYNGYATSDEAAANAKNIAYKAMDVAISNDMYTIIDWHILSDNNPQIHKAKALAFFDEVSKKYANNPAVLYEICNEPHGVSWQNDIKPYAEEVIKVIRANSPNAVIIVGTNTWSQDVDEASRDLLAYDNIMYSLHFYAGTHYLSNFKPRVEAALANNAPIFVTEWGTTDASGNGNVAVDSTNEWLAFLNSKNISWANWSLANKAESSAAISSSASASWSYNDLSQSGKLVFDYMKQNPGK